MKNKNTIISFARQTILVGQIFNAFFGVGIGALLATSLIFGDHFTTLLMRLETVLSVSTTTVGMRWLMIVGILAAAATQVILHILRSMVISLKSDDPFAAANASRLRTIGWAMLGLQALDFPLVFIRHYAPNLGDAVPNLGPSLTGWLAVLLVFVLAVVFEKGTSMRNYLAETI